MSCVQKKQLAELRAMGQPPALVKLTLEAICVMMGENVGNDWAAIRKVIARDDFVPTMTNFDVSGIAVLAHSLQCIHL